MRKILLFRLPIQLLEKAAKYNTALQSKYGDLFLFGGLNSALFRQNSTALK